MNDNIKRISLCSMTALLLWGFTACTASAEEDKTHDTSIVSYELSEAIQTTEKATTTTATTTSATVTTTTTTPAETTATTKVSTGTTEPCVVYCDPYDEEDYIDFLFSGNTMTIVEAEQHQRSTREF